MTEHAEAGGQFSYDDYSADVRDQARARVAPRASLRVDSAATFARAQVDAGNQYDEGELWHALKNRFMLRQALTIVGLLEKIMAWSINETRARQELPTWE